MRILSECNLALIVSELLNGKTVVFPTETSYGLGCDATNQFSINKIYDIKGRPEHKPLLVVVPDVESAKKILKWTPVIDKLADKYWPGPLTVVGENASRDLGNGVVSKEGTVAVRVTNHPLLRSITEKLGKPLVATSANISNAGDIYSSDEAISIFEKNKVQPDLILNFGTLTKNKPTTIVQVIQNEIRILRQGEILIVL